MNYGDVKTNFKKILFRQDITPSQVDVFMQNAIQRIQRNVRVPAMERLVSITVDSNWTGKIAVPGDFLRLISIRTDVNDFTESLRRADIGEVLRDVNTPGIPQWFAREGPYFWISYQPSQGTNFYIYYHADSSSLSADTDTNWMTDVAPDLLIYGALSYAADYFLDNERRDYFEQRFQQIVADLNGMAIDDELSGGSEVMPAYHID